MYLDPVYGKTEIKDPLILELIDSSSLKRLKGIDQVGYFKPYFPGIKTFSRFEHSLGVFILLKKFGASREEQIAGLIHDVSHAVFSHCIDYALEGGSEKEHTHQDDVFEEFVKNSEIPGILEKHGVRADYILDENSFPLLEKRLPDLCADRIDYSLRSGIHYKDIDKKDIKYFLDNLKIVRNNWVFKALEPAKKFAEFFKKMNDLYYADLNSAKMFRTVGDVLKHALEKGYLSEVDLYMTDKIVLDKIKNHLNDDEELRILFDRMNGKINIENKPDDYDISIFCKSRIVDPLFENERKIMRVSDYDKNWARVVEEESEPKEYFLKFAR